MNSRFALAACHPPALPVPSSGTIVTNGKSDGRFGGRCGRATMGWGGRWRPLRRKDRSSVEGTHAGGLLGRLQAIVITSIGVGKLSATLLFVMAAGFVGLGACVEDTDSSAPGDAAVAQREECTLRVGACLNKCYKADLGPECTKCCQEAGAACDANKSYSFFKCY